MFPLVLLMVWLNIVHSKCPTHEFQMDKNLIRTSVKSGVRFRLFAATICLFAATKRLFRKHIHYNDFWNTASPSILTSSLWASNRLKIRENTRRHFFLPEPLKGWFLGTNVFQRLFEDLGICLLVWWETFCCACWTVLLPFKPWVSCCAKLCMSMCLRLGQALVQGCCVSDSIITLSSLLPPNSMK